MKGDTKCRKWCRLSSKVIENSAIRQSAYEFLLYIFIHHKLVAFHSNYVPILHRFWDVARYWPKIADLNLPTSIWRPRWGDLVGISPRFSASENRSPWAIVWRCMCDPRFIYLCKTPTCDRQTDGQTEGWIHDDNIYRASIASRGKNVGQTWMALNTSKCNHLTPLRFEGLKTLEIFLTLGRARPQAPGYARG